MARIRRYLGRVEIWLDDREREALVHALDSLRGEVAPTGGEPVPHPRLRPRAYDDPSLESEFQRFTAPEVTALRGADVEAVHEDLAGRTQPLRLDDDRAMTWLRALNLLRLAAGGRLGIEDDGWEERVSVEPGKEDTWAMFLDLGWVQEGILAALES